MSQEFYDFEKVLNELSLEEDELKRLVSEGEIRAFRDADKMKFKAEDIDRFRKRSTGGSEDVIEALDKESSSSSASSPTIEAVDEIPEELVFDDEDDQEIGMVTEAIADDSFLNEDDEVESIDLAEAAPADKGKKKGRKGGAGKGAAGRSSGGRAASPPRRPARAASSRAAVEEIEEEGAVWKAVLGVSTIVVVIATFVVLDAARSHDADPTALSGWVSNMVRDMFFAK